MSPTWVLICMIVAFAAFVGAAAGAKVRSLNLVAVGLAAWVLPALWAAGEAFAK